MLSFFFHSDAYEINRSKLMGRHSAGHQLFQEILRRNDPGLFSFFVDDPSQEEVLRKKISGSRYEKISSIGSFFQTERPDFIFYPGPDTNKYARLRDHLAPNSFSIVGVSHTTLSKDIFESIQRYISDPYYPWDALICPSSSVRKMVQNSLNMYSEQLQDRFKVKLTSPIQLPVIPLGIDISRFSKLASRRETSREQLQLSERDILILFVGRMSFHGKSHPYPLYKALEAVQERVFPRKIVILECGWYANESIATAYEDLRKQLCPSIQFIFLDGRNQEYIDLSYSAADIFCSLSDNYQETFGLTPIEAMAAGVPVIATDWDGYRDSIIHGENGFLIKTYAADLRSMGDVCSAYNLSYLDYDHYAAVLASSVSIDLNHLIETLSSLIVNDELRRKISYASQKIAKKFDVGIMLDAYVSLHSELKRIRDDTSSIYSNAHGGLSSGRSVQAFSHYPTIVIGLETLLEVGSINTVDRYKSLLQLVAISAMSQIRPSEDQFEKIVLLLAKGQLAVSEILSSFPERIRPVVYRNLSWGIKFDLFRVVTIKCD
jgi:starch synthase